MAAPESVVQRTFAGGELAPVLHSRADHEKYLSGLRTCRNFLVLRGGGAANRPGFRFVAPCRSASPAVFLSRYVSEEDGQSVLLEIGNGYIRFFLNGAAVELTSVAGWDGGTSYVIGDIVTSGGVNYYARLPSTGVAVTTTTHWFAMSGSLLELPHPFGVRRFNVTQQARVLTLTHREVRPHELIFVSLTRWVLRAVSTAPGIAAPTDVVVTPGGAGTVKRGYIVTAASLDGYEESLPSAQVINTGSEPTDTDPWLITWTAPPGAAEFYVYCDPYANGTYGFLGTSTDVAEFNDPGFIPDFNLTAPLPRVLFDDVGEFPHTSGSYQQRRLFGDTLNNPDGVYGSRTGFRNNFNVSSPLQDDDAITFRLAGDHQHRVRWLLGLKQLVVLTSGGAWTVGEHKRPLTPSHLPADQETAAGASDVPPVVVANAILYVQSRQSIVRDLRFEQETEGFGGRDLTIYASHLFDGFTLRGLAFQETPQSIVWAVRHDGRLLGLTYLREQEVYGWHRHDTGASGRFEHVCVVPEAEEDVLYVVVRRVINGVVVRYIERLESREITTWDEDVFFVDSGLSYSGPPVSVIGGLEHLEGAHVAIVGDGQVVYDGAPSSDNTFRVLGGQITLPAAYSTIHAGLPIRHMEIETLDLDVAGTNVRDKQKRVGSVRVLVDESARTLWAGPDAAHLSQFRVRPYDPVEDAHAGPLEVTLSSRFNDSGRVLIRQTDPLPLTIIGVIPNVELGG